ncbi:MAG: J domain-containing protein [Geitlerinemataceae cyanobacterium]
MRDRSSPSWLRYFIIGVQLLVAIALLLAFIAPSLLSQVLLPCLIAMGLLLPFLGFKFVQQAFGDFGREMYLNSRQTTHFNRYWYDDPIEVDEPEPETPMDRERAELWSHLEVLRLGWPIEVSELTRAYHRRARETHPDTNGSGDKAEFVRVHQAYEAVRRQIERRKDELPRR